MDLSFFLEIEFDAIVDSVLSEIFICDEELQYTKI
jgi:hypothetical protein